MSFLRRQPAGTPTGGQFATGARSESGTTLGASAPPVRAWYPHMSETVEVALDGLGQSVDTTDESFPATEHAAAMSALVNLQDRLLQRHGLPAAVDGDGLDDLRNAVLEQIATSPSSPKTQLVKAAMRDPQLQSTADTLAHLSLGRYEDNVVHYLAALAKNTEETR